MNDTEIRARQLELNNDRLRAWEEGKRLLDDVAAQKRDLSAEERQTWDRINTEISSIDEQIKLLEIRETRERESAQLREMNERVLSTADLDKHKRDSEIAVDDFRAFLRGAHNPAWVDPESGKRAFPVDLRMAAAERALIRRNAPEAEFRALYWNTGSSGSLVPTTLARSLYEYMEASIAMMRAPTTKITTATGEALQFPYLTAHSIGTQVIAQGTAIGGTDPTFDRMQLDAYKFGQLVAVANEVLQDTVIDIGSFLGRDMGRGIGRLLDQKFTTGTGTGEPKGIMTAGSLRVTTGGSLITPTVEKLIDLEYSVPDEYRNGGAAGWVMSDSTAGTLRKLRDGAGGTIGAFLWEPSLTNGVQNGTPDRLLGFPVFTSANVATAGSANRTVAFGDLSAYYIRTVGSLVVESDSSYGFNTDTTYFRAKVRADGDLIDTAAVSVLGQQV